jgi:hypothetical protein
MIIERNTNMYQTIMKIFINGSFLLAFRGIRGCLENANGASYRSDSLNLGIINKRRYPGILG